MSEREDTGGERHEIETDLTGHRGDTEPSDAAREAQRDVPVDVEGWRRRDERRGTPPDDYVPHDDGPGDA